MRDKDETFNFDIVNTLHGTFRNDPTIHTNSPGGDKGNGGFRDSEGTGVMLQDAKSSLQQEMTTLLRTRTSKVYQSELCPKEIGLIKLSELIDGTTYDSISPPPVGRNTDSIDEARWFQINGQGKVEATKRFFDLFHGIYTVFYEGENDIAAKTKLLKPIRLGIVHESLHVFNYNQVEAKKCAPDVISLIESYNPEKLKTLITATDLENDGKVAEFLAQKSCLSEKQYQETKYNYAALRNSPAWADFQGLIKSKESRRVFKCVLELGYNKKVNPKDSVEAMLESLGNALVYSKSRNEVGAAVRKYLVFDFLTPLPTKK